MKKYKIPQAHEYELVEINRSLVMRQSWYKSRKGAEKFGGKAADYLSESMKIVWSEHLTYIAATNKKTLDARKAYAEKMRAKRERRENMEYATQVNKNAPRRELVPADKYEVGQKLHGYIITGLGQTFRPHADMFSWGITPDTERAQYAYFN